MKKILIIVIVLILISCACSICVLSYIGLVPGLSKLFSKQKDLNVTASEEVTEAYFQRVGYENTFYKNTEPVSGDLVYTGKITVNDSISDIEITSIMSAWTKWESNPISNPQVRINEDGTTEISAVVDVDKAKEFAKTLGYTSEEISKAEKYIKLLGNTVPVYAKGTASMTDNVVNMNLTSVKVANISLPQSIISKLNPIVEDAIEKRLSLIPNANIESVTFENGKMNIEGTFPQKEDIR